MKNLIRNSIGIHMLAILIFAIIYTILPINSFVFTDAKKQGNPSLLDYLNLSTTTQAGVGITTVTPNSDIAIILSTLQQILMITKNIFIVYFFTKN